MHHIIQSFLSWPDGSVWGNLVAELITGIPVWLFAIWRFEKRHKRHQAENRAAIHNQITQSLAQANLTEKSSN